MPIVDLATYNSDRQFPQRKRSVGRNCLLLVLFLSEGARFNRDCRETARLIFEKIISESIQIGLLEAIPGSDAMHLFICIRNNISPAQAADTLREKSEPLLLQAIPLFGKPVWSDDYRMQSLGGISKEELDNYRAKVSLEDGQTKL